MPEEIGAIADAGAAVADPTPEPEITPGAEPAPEPEPSPEPTPEVEPKPGEPKPGEEPVIETDGRKIEAAARQALADLKKTNPTAAKVFKDAYFGNQAVIKEIPEAKTTGDVIKAIRGMTATLDAVGGDTGIQELQTEVGDYRKEIQQFAEGDVKFIEDLYSEEKPHVLARAGRNVLDVLRRKNGQAYADAVTPSFDTEFESNGIYKDFAQVVEFIKEGKGQEAYDLALKLGKWFGAVRDQAKKVTDTAKSAPKDSESERNEARARELDQKEASIYTRDASANVDRLNNSEINKLTGPLARDLKLSADGKADFENGLRSRIWKKMAADKVYVQRAQALRNKGDMDKHVKFVHNKFAELLQDEFETYRNIRYPNMGSKPAPKAPPAAPTNGQKPHVVTSLPGQRPKHQDVDWSKTPDVLYMTGSAVLKNGKTVKFDPNSPANRF
jgi:hypothetical protein